LKTLGIPLLAGREFTEADSMDRPKVAIVNQAFADKFQLGANPIGKRFRALGPGWDMEIIGLFKDSAYNLVKAPFEPLFVVPWRQSEQAAAQGMSFYVRTALAPEPVLAAIPKIVAQVDSNLPALNIETLATRVRRNVQTDWLLTAISGALAAVATLLAAIGLYGVLSYTVAQRTREIGVRLALGARPGSVLRLVVGHSFRLSAIGVALGAAAALLLGPAIESQLYGVRPRDAATLATVSAALLAVALLAAYLPARRATRVDPLVALRVD
jgi:predicted permease